MISQTFPSDLVQPVPKGINGADIIQRVQNPNGDLAGSIIWESKRTKAWSEGWIQKIKDDQRQAKADIAIIVSDALPKDCSQFKQVSGIWVIVFHLILVYSAYEQTRLNELARDFLDLRTALSGIIDRLADLLPIVRKAVYFAKFRFSNSIKSVAPAFCPSFSYDDLNGIADGGAASTAFLQIASGKISNPLEVSKLRSELLAYCDRDTLAKVKLHQALTKLVVT